jgi:hypothetical protein
MNLRTAYPTFWSGVGKATFFRILPPPESSNWESYAVQDFPGVIGHFRTLTNPRDAGKDVPFMQAHRFAQQKGREATSRPAE